MKKILLMLVLCVSISIFANDYAIGLGIGKTLVSQEGNALKYSLTFSASFNASFTYKFNSKYFTEIKYTTDTTKLGMFLVEHNFIKQYTETYAYKICSIRYGINYKNVSVFIGVPLINSDKHTKNGYEIGIRHHLKVYKNLNYYTEARYIYAEKIIRDVVNAFIVDIGLKWSF